MANVEARIGDDGRTTLVAVSNLDPGPHHGSFRLQKQDDNLGEYGPVTRNWSGEHGAWIFDGVYDLVVVNVDGGDIDERCTVAPLGSKLKAASKRAMQEAKVEGVEPGIFDGDDSEGPARVGLEDGVTGTSDRGDRELKDLERDEDGKVNNPNNPNVVTSGLRAVNAGVPDEENVAADPNRDANPFNDLPDGDPRRAGQGKSPKPAAEEEPVPGTARPEGAWAEGIDPNEGRRKDGTIEGVTPPADAPEEGVDYGADNNTGRPHPDSDPDPRHMVVSEEPKQKKKGE